MLPKYLRDRKDLVPKEMEGAKADDDQAVCPPGHVTLPDTERKETLRMLRNSKFMLDTTYPQTLYDIYKNLICSFSIEMVKYCLFFCRFCRVSKRTKQDASKN